MTKQLGQSQEGLPLKAQSGEEQQPEEPKPSQSTEPTPSQEGNDAPAAESEAGSLSASQQSGPAGDAEPKPGPGAGKGKLPEEEEEFAPKQPARGTVPVPLAAVVAVAPPAAELPGSEGGGVFQPPDVRVLGFSAREEGRLVGRFGSDAKIFIWKLETPLQPAATELTAKVETLPGKGKVLTVLVNKEERYRGHLQEEDFTLPLIFQGCLPDLGKAGAWEVRAGSRATFFGPPVLSAATRFLQDPEEMDPDVWCPAVLTKMRQDLTFEAESQVPDLVYGTRKVTLEKVQIHDLRRVADRQPALLPERKVLLTVPREAPHQRAPSLTVEGVTFERLLCAPTPPRATPPAAAAPTQQPPSTSTSPPSEKKGSPSREDRPEPRDCSGSPGSGGGTGGAVRRGVLDPGLFRVSKDRRMVQVPCGVRELREMDGKAAVSLEASRRRAQAFFRFRLDGFAWHELSVEKHVTQFLPKDPRLPHGPREPVFLRLDGEEVLGASSADLGDRNSGDWEVRLRLFGQRRIRTRVHETDHCGLPLKGTQEVERSLVYTHELRLFLAEGHDLTRLQLEIDGTPFTALEHDQFGVVEAAAKPARGGKEKSEEGGSSQQQDGPHWVRRDALESAYPEVCRFPHVLADSGLRPKILESAAQPAQLLRHLGEAGFAWAKKRQQLGWGQQDEAQMKDMVVLEEAMDPMLEASAGHESSEGLIGWLVHAVANQPATLKNGFAFGCMTDYRAEGLKLPPPAEVLIPGLPVGAADASPAAKAA